MSIPSPPPPPPPSSTSLTRLINTTLSYDTNVMLAAIISLLLVILFVLLLHLYTRWFLLQARRRTHTQTSISTTVPHVLTSRLHQRFTIIDTSNSDTSSTKLGLPISIISSLPLFVHNLDNLDNLECAICLCLFEQHEIGRKLPNCGHAFHVECIDMWLHSHATCPICRAAIQFNSVTEITDPDISSNRLTVTNNDDDDDSRLEIVTVTTISESSSSIGESEFPKRLLSRSGKVYPSLTVNGDETED